MSTQTKMPGSTDLSSTTVTNENPVESIASDSDSNITPEELDLLDNAGTDNNEELTGDQLLDDTDEEGEELNEADDLSGSDLDVPGTEADDLDETMGEEDEENNSYSMSDQDDEEEDDDSDPIA